jgi:hypothetical protein
MQKRYGIGSMNTAANIPMSMCKREIDKMNFVRMLLIVAIIALTCSSCRKEIHIPYRVGKALELAGNNKDELLKVLEHYQAADDSLKLRAAYFLIDNLEGKKSYSGKSYNHLRDLIGSYASDTSVEDESLKSYGEKLDKVLSSYNNSDFEFSEDVKHLTGKYLIDYIDKAFQSIEMPWNKGRITFDTFCKYVLPYKMGDEPIEDWRSAVLQDFRGVIDSLSKTNMVYCDAARVVNAEIAKRFKPRGVASYSMSFGYSDLKKIKYGSCYDGVVYTMCVMRALGIPVCMDHTPAWGNRNGSHEWVALMLPGGKSLPFDPTYKFEKFYERFHSHINRAVIPPNNTLISKIYRKTYDDENGGTVNDDVPLFFRQHIVDVTAQYALPCEVSFSAKEIPLETKHAFLFGFDVKGWTPVQMVSTRSHERITFKDVCRDVVYLPGFISSNQIVPLNVPFMFDQHGKMRKFASNDSRSVRCMIYRKYPYSERMISYADRMRGGIFQISSSSDFINATTVHVIQKCPDPYYQEILIKQVKAYRYFRYVSPDSGYGDVAEIEVYARNNNEPLYGKCIGTKGCDIHKAFDQDKSTYYSTQKPNGNWIGMDFGKPIVIQKIRYLPRNDGNTIEPGDEYELFYWNGEWRSLGVQKATQYSLKYSAPENALLWLKDLTKGKEERIFTYEHGKQVWW